MKINTGKEIQSCAVTDSSCEAECHCSDGFSGIACEIPDDDLRTRQALRTSLIGSLGLVLDTDDVSPMSVESWATFLSVVTQNPFEVSAADSSVTQDLALRVINEARSLQFKHLSSLDGVLQSVNAMFSVAQFNYNPSDLNSNVKVAYNNFTASNILRIVGTYAQMVAESIV